MKILDGQGMLLQSRGAIEAEARKVLVLKCMVEMVCFVCLQLERGELLGTVVKQLCTSISMVIKTFERRYGEALMPLIVK